MKFRTIFHVRFFGMSPSDRFWAMRNAAIDALLVIFLGAMAYVGLAADPGAFYFWMPFLGIIAWARWKQMKRRWAL